MNLIKSKQQTMTSLEISELVESRHDSVKRTIERLAKSENIQHPPLVDIKNKQNQKVQVYLIGKRDSYVVVAQLSPEFTARLVDRWQELEEKEQFKIPQTLPEALQLAADLALKIEQDKPKIEVYERLADRKSDVSTTILAKQLGTTAIQLNRWLRDIGAKWQQADLPKAGFQDWMNVVADIKNGHEFTQCLITPKGQIEITKLWNKTKV